jgi:O-antigen ligase
VGWFLYNLSSNRFERIITLSVSIIGVIALYLTASRSGLALLTVVIIVMLVKRLNIKSLGYINLSFIILFFFIILFSAFLLHYPESFQKLNTIFSNRLNIWLNVFRDTFSVNPYSILWGGKQAILRSTSALSGIDGGSISSVFGRYRLDSTYIEMLLMYGVIGLVLFIFIFFRLLQFSIRKQRALKNKNAGNIYSLAIAVIIGILVASFPSSLIPSMGNLINVALLPVAIALLYVIKPDINNSQ